MDGLWTEVCGQQKQSNDPGNNQHNPQYANYWAPLTRKRHTMPHSAQPQHTNCWAPRTRKRHQQEHRPQRPTERSDPTQHAKGRTGDCPGPRKGAITRRNVTRGGSPPPLSNASLPPPPHPPGGPSGGPPDLMHSLCHPFLILNRNARTATHPWTSASRDRPSPGPPSLVGKFSNKFPKKFPKNFKELPKNFQKFPKNFQKVLRCSRPVFRMPRCPGTAP